jgi:hypothetical protein
MVGQRRHPGESRTPVAFLTVVVLLAGSRSAPAEQPETLVKEPMLSVKLGYHLF